MSFMKLPTLISLPMVLFSTQLSAQIVSAVTIPLPVNNERRTVAKATVTLHESYENVFWSLYDQYEHQLPVIEVGMETLYEQLQNKEMEAARITMESVLENQYREVAVRRDFMEKFNNSMNGQVALQFLQSEILHDLILRSRTVEESKVTLPQWNVAMLKDEKVKQSVMAFTLGVTQEDEGRFRKVYEDFNFDYSRVVGHQLVWFEQYIEDVSELTPAQSLKLAREFVAMQFNELKVKENYFKKINEEFGTDMAVRFFHTEEYFDMMSKLKVWADLQKDDSR